MHPRYSGDRSVATEIYFMLCDDDISELHRLKSDELWLFHEGDSLLVSCISETGRLSTLRLGPDTNKGDAYHLTIPAGTWFGAHLENSNSHVLMSCTVAPGFDFTDFELGKRNDLCRRFPEHAQLIKTLTRPDPETLVAAHTAQ